MDIEKKTQGEWEGGMVSGFVTFNHPDGRVYEGEWKDGKPHGKGTYKLPDGSKYSGGWKDGHINGNGIWTEPDGPTHVGQFKENMLWKGTFIFEDGEKFVGEWNKDGPWNIDYFDKNGELVGQMCEGEVSGHKDFKTYNGKADLNF